MPAHDDVWRMTIARQRETVASIPVQTELRWRPAAPLEVQLSFRTGRQGWVEWVIGRDLLRAGLGADELVGDGDVRIGPDDDHACTDRGCAGHVILELVDAEKDRVGATFAFDRDDLQGFLADTHDQVAQGDEDVTAALDAAIARLLADA